MKLLQTDIYNDGVYLANNPGWHGADSVWKANHVLQLLNRNNIAPASIVEVGCGAGGIIAEVARKLPATTATGFDVSKDAARLWPKQLPSNLEYQVADFTQTSQSYDALMLIDVFEHVEDYIGFLRSLRNRAGAFVFHIPLDLSILGLLRRRHIQGRDEVGHLHYFTTESALATLETAGYSVIDWHFTALSIEASKDLATWRTHLLNVPRRIVATFSPSAAATWFGGYSIMVLAKPTIEKRTAV